VSIEIENRAAHNRGVKATATAMAMANVDESDKSAAAFGVGPTQKRKIAKNRSKTKQAKTQLKKCCIAQGELATV